MSAAYTVFIDESFGEGFTKLSGDDAYFCYGALMVPTANLPDLKRFWTANRGKLIEAYQHATGHEIKAEFKSVYLNKLAFPVRKTFSDRLSYFLSKNDCFVAGYYTTVRNLLLYRLRTEVATDDDAKELPAEWEVRLAPVREELLADKDKHPGDGKLLVDLFHGTLSITLNWLGSGKNTFGVVYDPRQKKEDRFLIQHADDWLTREAEFKELKGVYNGTTNAIASSDSPGLMLVDLIVRDVRHLFKDVPELLSEHSTSKLVLPVPQGCEPVIRSFAGRHLKWGNRHPMSNGLADKLRTPSPNSMLPLYTHRLADQKLSCEAACGESRVINFGLGCFEDMTD